MTGDTWLTTREVASRLGLRHLRSLRERLDRLGVPHQRLGRFGRIRWLWSGIEAAFHEEREAGNGR